MRQRKIVILLMLSFGMSTLSACAKGNYNKDQMMQQSKVAAVRETKEKSTCIRITYEGGEAIAVLNDSLSAESLLAQLPVTVTFSDFQGAEKTSYLPDELLAENYKEPYDPQKGEIASYAPWGNLVLYYEDQPQAAGIIPMGHIITGLEELKQMDTDFEAVMERITVKEEQKCSIRQR